LTRCWRAFNGGFHHSVENLAIDWRQASSFLLGDELRQAIFVESLPKR
jgi:hypothetical protein